MGRTPKEVFTYDGSIECHPWEPDDKGGGFPVIHIEATIYGPKDLRRAIRALKSREKWITNQAKKYGGE